MNILPRFFGLGGTVLQPVGTGWLWYGLRREWPSESRPLTEFMEGQFQGPQSLLGTSPRNIPPANPAFQRIPFQTAYPRPRFGYSFENRWAAGTCGMVRRDLNIFSMCRYLVACLLVCLFTCLPCCLFPCLFLLVCLFGCLIACFICVGWEVSKAELP